MVKKEQLQERLNYDRHILNSDVTSEKNGDWVDVSEYDKVVFYASATDLADTNTVTLTVQEADDNSGTNSQDLSTTTGDSDGGADVDLTKEHLVTDLSSGKTHVRPQLKSEGSAVVGTVVGVRGDGRYDPQN